MSHFESLFSLIKTATFSLVLLGGLFFSAWAVQAASLNELNEEIKKIESQIDILEKKSQEYQTVINQKRKDINTLSNRISIYNNKISQLENNIYLTDQEIKLKNLLIQGLEIEVDRIALDMQEKRATLAHLIQTIDILDKKGIIEVFFEGEKLSDFFDQARYIEMIHKTLNESLQEVKELRAALENKKIASEQEKRELEELKRKTAIQKYALDEEKKEQNALLSATKGEEAKYQQLLSQTQKAQAKLVQEMVALEKEIERLKNYLYYGEAGQIPPAGTRIFRWPQENAILTQGYGMTSFARSGAYGGAGHNGIDMSAGAGSDILAAADGEVLVKGTHPGWGNWIALKHDNGMVTLYAHMIKPSFRETGEKVSAGDIIGYEGSTGFSTGSHLHFSVYHKFFTYLKDGLVYFNYFDGTLNPLDYL